VSAQTASGRPGSVRGALERRQRQPYGVLVGCFVAVIVCFVAATMSSESRALDTDEPIAAIAATTLPAVMHVAAVRTELHGIESMVEEAADGHPWGRGSLRIARARLAQEWASLRILAQPRSAELERATESLTEAENVLDIARARLLDDNLDAARETLATRLVPSFAGADRSLDALAGSLVGEAGSQLRRAHAERRRAARAALLWNALSVALAVLLGALGILAVRRHARLLESRASELEQFADRVAHDIRGPMNPALMALEMGAADVGLRPPLQKAMERGARSLQVVNSIITDLLAFARSGARPEPGASAELRDAMRDVLIDLRSLAEAERIDLDVEPFGSCVVACGAGIVASIVSNLVRNAITHMGDSNVRRIRVRARVARHVRLEVADTGAGMSSDLADIVFEPRVRGSRTGDGLGLGLATVRRLVEAHGGRVGVESLVGHGSTFWVTLPSVR
jgi:signal transduction histidine kinase